MAEIAGEEVLPELSSYELGLLLLAAYLHDIGMTPPAARVSTHFTYLLTGDRTDLSDADVDDLQAFLDDHWDGIVPPLSRESPTALDIARTRRIVAAYIRARHNEWSAQWMRENLTSPDLPFYSGWLADLIRLCKSHHFGVDELRKPEFDPRLKGSPAAVVHLRYCAFLLRVADVMDFDPERTPAILYTHHAVDDSSEIFWNKDHSISFEMEGGHISIHAEPPNSTIHHAVVQTVEDLERELLLCDRLVEETQVRRMVGRQEDLPHRWRLSAHVRSFITPLEDCYEYVDGTFRPDPKRVLDLVGGVELYGSRLVAAREILQNSFDAVREQIAFERLLRPDPGAAVTLEEIARTHRVRLELEPTEEGARLTCYDTGSGMTKDILLSRFLVGGKGVSHETRELERRCNGLGFSVGRTARFGIGVLSYFLLGSSLEVSTLRSIEAGGREGTGWLFSSNGFDDFGELSKVDSSEAGTKLTLAIASDLLDAGYAEFARELDKYLKKTIKRVPCRFSFEAVGVEGSGLELEPGWPEREGEVRETIVSGMSYGISPTRRSIHPERLSFADQSLYAEEISYWDRVFDRARDDLVLSVETGALPGNLGAYRIFTGYFKLCELTSLAFIDLKRVGDGTFEIKPMGREEGPLGYRFQIDLTMSWNGMNVTGYPVQIGHSDTIPPNSLIEVDWTSDAAGRLAVDRNRVDLSPAAGEATKFLRARAEARVAELLETEGETPLTLLNSLIAGVTPPTGMKPFWNSSGPATSEHDGVVQLRPLDFPIRDADRTGRSLRQTLPGGEALNVPPIFRISGNRERGGAMAWHGYMFAPTKAMFYDHDAPRLATIWERLPDAESDPTKWDRVQVEFPPSLDAVVGYHQPRSIVFNQAHPLVSMVDHDSWMWARKTLKLSEDPLDFRDELLSSRARFAAWVLSVIPWSRQDEWLGLIDRDSDFLVAGWELLDPIGAEDELIFIGESYDYYDAQIVGLRSWKLDKEAAVKEWLTAAASGLSDWWLQDIDDR